MKNFIVKLKGQTAKEIEAEELTGLDALKLLEAKGLDRVVAVKVNGENRDLFSSLEEKAELEPVDVDSPEGLEILRHSTSHVMAMAVKDLFPGVKVTIGPAIENGFYYDFDYERPFRDEDLARIQEKMSEIIKANLPFERKELSAQEALDFFNEAGGRVQGRTDP